MCSLSFLQNLLVTAYIKETLEKEQLVLFLTYWSTFPVLPSFLLRKLIVI